MALNSVCGGEERIANELLLKLGILVSPRTVRKYMPNSSGGGPRGTNAGKHFYRIMLKPLSLALFAWW
jgi:putative transposase